jgi:hypothetical protein
MLGWLRRLQSAKTVIAPGDGTDSVEIVDVKDVADFLVPPWIIPPLEPLI